MMSGVDLTSVFTQSELHFGKTIKSTTAIKGTEPESSIEEPIKKTTEAVQAEENAPDEQSMDKKKKKKKKSKRQDDVKADCVEELVESNEKHCRTVFVGNVSLEASSKKLSQHFLSCGEIESVRFRSVPVAGCAIDQHGNQRLMMKVCANKRILNNAKDFANAYIAFVSPESVPKALALNGTLFMNRIIQVDREQISLDPLCSVFVGNIPFKAAEEKLASFFNSQLRLKGDTEKPVLNVRIIRDKSTGLGKGFGYVRFHNAAYVPKALSIHGKKFDGRELRITVCGKRFKNRKGEIQVTKKLQSQLGFGAVSRVRMKRKVAQDQVITPLKSSIHASIKKSKKMKKRK